MAKVMFAQSKPSVYKRSVEIALRDGKSNVLQILGINSNLAQKLMNLKKSLRGVYVKVGQRSELVEVQSDFRQVQGERELKTSQGRIYNHF